MPPPQGCPFMLFGSRRDPEFSFAGYPTDA